MLPSQVLTLKLHEEEEGGQTSLVRKQAVDFLQVRILGSLVEFAEQQDIMQKKQGDS